MPAIFLIVPLSFIAKLKFCSFFCCLFVSLVPEQLKYLSSRLYLKFHIGCHIQRYHISLNHAHFVSFCSDKPRNISGICFIFLRYFQCFCHRYNFLLNSVALCFNSNQREIFSSLILTILYTCRPCIILLWRSIFLPIILN